MPVVSVWKRSTAKIAEYAEKIQTGRGDASVGSRDVATDNPSFRFWRFFGVFHVLCGQSRRFKRQRDRLRARVLVDLLEHVDLERPADPVTHEVFERGVNGQGMGPRAPGLVGGESPASLFTVDVDPAGDRSASRIEHSQDSAEHGVVERFRKEHTKA